MKTWVWVLLLVAIVLFLWTIQREGFQQTASLKGPPYGDTDYIAIVGMMPAGLLAALRAKNNSGPVPTGPNADLTAYRRKLVDGVISDTMGEFYSTVYQPATVSVTSAKVDTFMTTYLAQIKTTTPSAYTFLSANKSDVSALLVAYFVTQPAGAANLALTTEQTTSANASTVGGTGGTGGAAGGTTGNTTGGAAGGTTGNTTGGSSTTASANSGTNKGNIFGPAFTGFGENTSGSGGLGARDYPTLIGPKPVVSRYVEGAGVMNLSQSDNLAKSGALPGAAGTGSDPNSRFFGSSRVPGDRDLIPDAGQQFTPSIGSSKTEPVPYLADFSAFAT